MAASWSERRPDSASPCLRETESTGTLLALRDDRPVRRTLRLVSEEDTASCVTIIVYRLKAHLIHPIYLIHLVCLTQSGSARLR